MRVSDGGARARDAPAGAPPGRFGEALRRAREDGAARTRSPAVRDGARADATPRARSDPGGAALARRRARRGEDQASLPGADARATAPGTAATGAAEVEDAARLGAVLRALPVAVDASRIREGAPLSLSLGRALDVDLRAAPGGVEVVLRPAARLARAAEAELPALVASLRSRGIAVARAEVRARGGRGGAGRAR